MKKILIKFLFSLMTLLFVGGAVHAQTSTKTNNAEKVDIQNQEEIKIDREQQALKYIKTGEDLDRNIQGLKEKITESNNSEKIKKYQNLLIKLEAKRKDFNK